MKTEIEKIHPFSDYKIRNFIRNNKNMYSVYEEKVLSEFLKEIILLKSEMILSELVKIPDIYKIKIKDEEEVYTLLHYIIKNNEEKSQLELIENFIAMNEKRDKYFLQYHIDNECDLLHVLVQNSIVPFFGLTVNWFVLNEKNKTVNNKKYGNALLSLFDLQEDLMFKFIKRNINYFGEELFGDEFEQKELIFDYIEKTKNEIKTFFRFDKEKNENFIIEKMLDKYNLINEIKILNEFYLKKKTKFLTEENVYKKIKSIWNYLEGSDDKKERDLKYMFSNIEIFNEENLPLMLSYVSEIKNELKTLKDIIVDNQEKEVEKKKKRI